MKSTNVRPNTSSIKLPNCHEIAGIYFAVLGFPSASSFVCGRLCDVALRQREESEVDGVRDVSVIPVPALERSLDVREDLYFGEAFSL